MTERAIKIKFSREAVLRPLWFDEVWYQELLDEGWTKEGALREMLREGYREDWTSILQELLESEDSYADTFADSCEVDLVDVHRE